MNILLIEDDFVDTESVRRLLKKAFPDCIVHHASCLSEALEETENGVFDVVLSDLSLPDGGGLDTVNQMVQACPTSPLIVLTGNENEDFSLKVLSLGAQDYLVKGRISRDLLERSIRYAIQRHALALRNEELVANLRESDLLMQEKNKKLERACKTAQQFVDNVSHEFRTPLTVIMEYASLLADSVAGPVNEDQAKLLGVIDDRASDLNNMVDDMLDVSKLESGLLGASRTKSSVADMIEHVLPAIRRKADVRQVSLHVEIEDDLPDVYCDPGKVGRVIVNLAINAIKFTRESGDVRLFARRFGVNDVSIGVSDNGVGIPEERQREIFQRFSQVKTELRESTKGFGLGLNIALELVELNFGKMSVESTEGEGSTFSFTLPVGDPSEVTRRFLDRLPLVTDGSASVSVLHIATEEHLPDATHEDVERFLVHVLRQNDLIFPVSKNQWLLLVSAPAMAVGDFCKRLDLERSRINRNRPRGPLPELEIMIDGTWTVEDAEQIVGVVDAQFEQEVACGV